MQSGIHLKGMLGIHADQCGAALAERFVKRPDQERLIRMGTAGKEDALSFRIFTSEGAHAVEESLPAESRLPAFRLPPLQRHVADIPMSEFPQMAHRHGRARRAVLIH